MLSEMDNLLFYPSALTVGPYSLVVGAVSLSVSLYVHRSYVDGDSVVVFIIDTMHYTIIWRGSAIHDFTSIHSEFIVVCQYGGIAYGREATK
jgi:hypothetical protein